MATFLKQKLISCHFDLISKVETKYMNHIHKLLQQKREIICKMQQSFYIELENLNNLCNLPTSFIQNEYNYNQSINAQTNSSRIQTEPYSFVTKRTQLHNNNNSEYINNKQSNNQSN
eukprot:412542_1